MASDFLSKLQAASSGNSSLLCVGLDSELSKLPPKFKSSSLPQFEFNREIIDATLDLVSCYKPNAAFYEAEGYKGFESLLKTIEYISGRVPVILDAKRGDIGNTSRMYAKAAFEILGADAITVHGYMGTDSVVPFLEFPGKGVFVLVKTSNPGSVDIQDLKSGDQPVYMRMASQVSKWSSEHQGRCGVVVGATFPDELKAVRTAVAESPILVPGVGAQGGDVQKTVAAGRTEKPERLIINASRGVIFASSGDDFQQKAREAAMQLKSQINSYL